MRACAVCVPISFVSLQDKYVEIFVLVVAVHQFAQFVVLCYLNGFPDPKGLLSTSNYVFRCCSVNQKCGRQSSSFI